MFNLIWPERRTVADHVVLGWAKDAFANGEIGEAPRSAAHAANLLDQAGLVTFGSPLWEHDPAPAWR